MRSLKIDTEFQNLIPPLTDDEFKQLKENIITDGCREPLVVWNDVLVDGHNRYKICTENNIPFETVNKEFVDRSAVIEWMLRNQLGRRNLNDFQRNEIALKYQEVIAEEMKKRQAEYHGNQYQKMDIRPDGQKSKKEPTTQRKEMAKIAGTSEGSIQRSKLIIEKGTQEQIDRARKGGKGNSVTAISKEINKSIKEEKEKNKQEKVEQEVSEKKHRKKKEFLIDGVPLIDFSDESHLTPDTIEDLLRDFSVNFYGYLGALRGIIESYEWLLEDKENNKKMAALLSEAAAAMEQLKGDYIDE